MLKFTEVETELAHNLDVSHDFLSNSVLTNTSPVRVDCTHEPHHFKTSNVVKPFCSVCRTEEHIGKKSCGSFSKGTLAYCKQCNLFAHRGIPRENSEWHNLPDLSGKTCFEIMHSNCCEGLWMGNTNSGKRKSVCLGHSAYKAMQKRFNHNV